MPASNALARRLKTRLRRLAQDDGVEAWLAGQHRIKIGVRGDAIKRGIAAGDRDQFYPVGLGNSGQMLVTRNLAKADEAQTDWAAHRLRTATRPSCAS